MKDLQWQSFSILKHEIPVALHGWLCETGSFMERLKAHGRVPPPVQVLQEIWDLEEDALVREVLIADDTHSWMFARAVFPRDTLESVEELKHLGNRSLGSVLFKDPTLTRSEFEVTCISDGLFYEKMISYLKIKPPVLWARRSVFHIQNKPLLLIEVFFPDVADV